MSRGLQFTVSLGVLSAAVGGGILLLRSQTQEVTVYSSLPLQGPTGAQSADMVRGIRLALEESHDKAGKFKVNYVSLNDATDGAKGWAPKAVVENALRAADDSSTVVYIGEYDSGASAISIPILNRAKIPQISPSNTAVGLTTNDQPGAQDGEPDKYYVNNNLRSYVRLVPRDKLQGAALANVMRDDRKCTRVAIIYDADLYGSALAQIIRQRVNDQKPKMKRVLDEPFDAQLDGYDETLADRVANQKANCVVFSGTTSAAAGLFKHLVEKLPQAHLYGSSGVAHHDITDALAPTYAPKVRLTFPALGSEGVGAAGRRFYRRFRQEYTANPDPYAIYAYEAMLLAIDAIKRAGTTDREDIIKALHETKDRRSAIGRYSIDENGDTTLTGYGLFGIGTNGVPFFKHRVKTD
jgi:branched-chain amino acid transport system substrate-binding protein